MCSGLFELCESSLIRYEEASCVPKYWCPRFVLAVHLNTSIFFGIWLTPKFLYDRLWFRPAIYIRTPPVFFGLFSAYVFLRPVSGLRFILSVLAISLQCCLDLVCQGVVLVDNFWGVLVDCAFLTCFDFRGFRIGRRLSVPWQGMIETNLSIQRDARVGRRLSASLSVATLSPFLILLSSWSPWGGKPSLVICRLPVFFNGVISLGIVSTEWEQRTVSICFISSLFLTFSACLPRVFSRKYLFWKRLNMSSLGRVCFGNDFPDKR